MSRQARIVLPNFPHHIIQRGHNKQPVFFTQEDYIYYLESLQEWRTRLNCKIYAFCLMTNHIHLIIDPGDTPENMALLMKHVAGRQTRYINTKHKNTGSLWEGRYKSSPIQSEEYLLACCRYIELNPVRAKMVTDPTHYLWSSCRTKLNLSTSFVFDQSPLYQSLGSNREIRSQCYRKWLYDAIPKGEYQFLRESIQRGQLTGNTTFRQQISKRLGKNMEHRGPGRPRKIK
jgi:putative transposase